MKYTKEQIDKGFLDTMKKEYNITVSKVTNQINPPLPKSYKDHMVNMYKAWLNILHESGDITDEQLKSFKMPLWAYNLNLW